MKLAALRWHKNKNRPFEEEQKKIQILLIHLFCVCSIYINWKEHAQFWMTKPCAKYSIGAAREKLITISNGDSDKFICQFYNTVIPSLLRRRCSNCFGGVVFSSILTSSFFFAAEHLNCYLFRLILHSSPWVMATIERIASYIFNQTIWWNSFCFAVSCFTFQYTNRCSAIASIPHNWAGYSSTIGICLDEKFHI